MINGWKAAKAEKVTAQAAARHREAACFLLVFQLLLPLLLSELGGGKALLGFKNAAKDQGIPVAAGLSHPFNGQIGKV